LTPEQIIGLLRQAEVELARGRTVGEVCHGLGVSGASFYRWRSEYGGLKVDQARRMKELVRENARLLGRELFHSLKEAEVLIER
jgi:hypothetical protein